MDYQAALKDGHAPEEIMGELARRGVKMDYKAALADGHDPMEVLAEMNRRESASSQTPSSQTPMLASHGSARLALVPTVSDNRQDVLGIATPRQRQEAAKLREPNKPATTLREFAGNAVKNVIELPLAPVRMVSDIANAPDSGEAAWQTAKGMVTTPLSFTGLMGLDRAKDAWLRDPAIGALSLAGIAKAGRGLKNLAPVEKTATRQLGERFNVPTTLGEDLKNPLIQKTEVLTENIPFSGMVKFRNKQGAAAKQASQDFLNNFVVEDSGNVAASNRAFANNMYEGVKDLVAEVPNQSIKPTNTKAIATDILNRYPDIFKKLQDTKTEGLVNDIVHGLKPVETPASRVLGPDGLPAVPASTTPKTLTFDEAWALRQGLGDKIGQAKQLLARGDIDHTAYSQLKKLFAAVSDDLDSWTTQIKKPEIMKQFRDANDAYKQYVVKYDVIQRAFDKASGEVGAGETFSPKKFSTALKAIAYKDKVLKTFTPEEIDNMTGLANILQTVKRAGQIMENPPTGNRWGPVTLGGVIEGSAYTAGGLAAAIKTAGLGAVTTAAIRFLTTTPKGKNLAYRASHLKPSSAAMGKIMQEVSKNLVLSETAAKNNNPLGMTAIEQAALTPNQ